MIFSDADIPITINISLESPEGSNSKSRLFSERDIERLARDEYFRRSILRELYEQLENTLDGVVSTAKGVKFAQEMKAKENA